MNRIRDATFILVTVLAVVFLLGGYFLLEDKNRLIETTREELKGVKLERALFGLMQTMLATDTRARTIDIERTLRAIDVLNMPSASTQPLLPVREWDKFKASPHLDSLIPLMRDVGDTSTLILDPEMASYYLMDITITLVPMIIQHISQTRVSATHAIASKIALTPEFIYYRRLDIAPLLTRLLRSTRIVRATKTIPTVYGSDTRAIDTASASYHALLDTLLHQPRALSTTEWSNRFSEIIRSYVILYNVSSDFLVLHLQQRIKENTQGRILIIFFLFIIYCLVITIGYVALKNYVQKREVMAAREMTHIMSQLEKTNSELEHFAYIASHDLKEPLRTIASFARLLQQKYSTGLDATGQEYLNILITASMRMQRMISDLLDYARVDYEVSKAESFDCSTELHLALENLKQPIEQSGAIVTCDAMPVLTHHGAQFAQLMQNLIGNAIKYRREDVTPHIHIGFKELPDAWQFSVRDNGLGIDNAYFNKIFEPFKRLHTQHQFEGNGIGLAICKKMVERMGGKIWLTSQPNEGSIFYFTLMKKTSP